MSMTSKKFLALYCILLFWAHYYSPSALADAKSSPQATTTAIHPLQDAEWDQQENINCRFQSNDFLIGLDENGNEFEDLNPSITGCYLSSTGSTSCFNHTLYQWVCWSGSWYCYFYSPSCFWQAIGCCWTFTPHLCSLFFPFSIFSNTELWLYNIVRAP